MSITRRDALTAAVGCGLVTTAARADEKPVANDAMRRDPVLNSVPDAVRKVFEATFPGHRCIRMVIRGAKAAPVYRGTFFNPAIWSRTSHSLADGETIITPPLYQLELDAAGKVLEETLREIEPTQLPKAVLAAYDKWNPNGVEGRSGHFWLTEVAMEQPRVYRIRIILSSVTAYEATFREDGTVVQADPAIIP